MLARRRLVGRWSVILFAAALSADGCASPRSSAGASQTGAPAPTRADAAQPDTAARATAERFIAALNAGDVESLVGITADTLLFREQRWTTASDGTGFVLGPAADTVAAGASGRRVLLAALTSRVHVSGPRAAARPPTRETLLGRELARADPRWERLALFVFLRGEGDVEHTALVGVDPTTGKIAALYLN